MIFLENSHPIGSFPLQVGCPQAPMAADLDKGEKVGFSHANRSLLGSLDVPLGALGDFLEDFTAPVPVSGSDLNSGGELSR